MKRQILIAVVSLSMVFALGCDQEAANEQTQTEESTQNQAPNQNNNPAAQPGENLAETPTSTVQGNVVKPEVATNAALADTTQAAGSPLCTVSGAAGTTADCQVSVAVEAGGDVATGLQATLNFDSSVMTLEGFYRNGTKVDNGGVVSDRGHVLRFGSVAEVADGARMKLMVLKFSQPFEAVTDAAEGTGAELVTARFTFNSDVRGDSPQNVHISGVVATSPEATKVGTRVEGNTIVTGRVLR
jgi:hypothetical protein